MGRERERGREGERERERDGGGGRVHNKSHEDDVELFHYNFICA